MTRLTLECEAPTFAEARDDAASKTAAMCADGWRWIRTAASPAKKIVVVTLERAE